MGLKVVFGSGWLFRQHWKLVDADADYDCLNILMLILMRTMIVKNLDGWKLHWRRQCTFNFWNFTQKLSQNLDGWKLRRRKQSEEAIVRVSEIKRVADQEQENGGRRKS